MGTVFVAFSTLLYYVTLTGVLCDNRVIWDHGAMMQYRESSVYKSHLTYANSVVPSFRLSNVTYSIRFGKMQNFQKLLNK